MIYLSDVCKYCNVATFVLHSRNNSLVRLISGTYRRSFQAIRSAAHSLPQLSALLNAAWHRLGTECPIAIISRQACFCHSLLYFICLCTPCIIDDTLYARTKGGAGVLICYLLLALVILTIFNSSLSRRSTTPNRHQARPHGPSFAAHAFINRAPTA